MDALEKDGSFRIGDMTINPVDPYGEQDECESHATPHTSAHTPALSSPRARSAQRGAD